MLRPGHWAMVPAQEGATSDFQLAHQLDSNTTWVWKYKGWI